MAEFGNLSPNSPNLRRRMDPREKEKAVKHTAKIEDEEKQRRELERISGLAPARAPLASNKVAFALSEDKTVVSLPVHIADLRASGVLCVLCGRLRRSW